MYVRAHIVYVCTYIHIYIMRVYMVRENGFNSGSAAVWLPPQPHTAQKVKQDKGGSRSRLVPGLRRCPRWMRTPAGRPGQAGDPGEPVQPQTCPLLQHLSSFR